VRRLRPTPENRSRAADPETNRPPTRSEQPKVSGPADRPTRREVGAGRTRQGRASRRLRPESTTAFRGHRLPVRYFRGGNRQLGRRSTYDTFLSALKRTAAFLKWQGRDLGAGSSTQSRGNRVGDHFKCRPLPPRWVDHGDVMGRRPRGPRTGGRPESGRGRTTSRTSPAHRGQAAESEQQSAIVLRFLQAYRSQRPRRPWARTKARSRPAVRAVGRSPAACPKGSSGERNFSTCRSPRASSTARKPVTKVR